MRRRKICGGKADREGRMWSEKGGRERREGKKELRKEQEKIWSRK